MNKELFNELAQKPFLLNRETLADLSKAIEEFPSFHAAWMVYLKNLKQLDDPGFDAALKKAAPLIPSRKQLYRYLNSDDESSKLNSELNKSGAGIPEYSLEQPEPASLGNNLIDKFLSASSGSMKLDKLQLRNQSFEADNQIIEKSLAENDELVTETLANIYVEQKKYDRALEAFKTLGLKFPEKNSYFATRIEEIIKLKNI